MFACGDDVVTIPSDDGPSETGSGDGETGSGDGATDDGDRDGSSGDGDGDPGDGDPSEGDGDGDPGDGDGDPEPKCGNGTLEPGEACDDGNPDDTDACLSTCVAASCGDGHEQAGVEACDDANFDNTDTCLTSCVAASCGDGYVGPGEACDDGNDVDGDECTNICGPTSCGDSVVQQGEDCDDGDLDNEDECLSNCVTARCGDAYTWAGQEACDDGDANNEDGCIDTCELASCGDGFLYVGTEDCDDANDDGTDACTNECNDPACGDGLVWQGVEECDGGNSNDDDSECLNSCELAACGDGFVWQGVEPCDDGNDVDFDGCEPDCSRTPIVTGASAQSSNCVVLAGQSVLCWGANGSGQLGHDNTASIGDNPGELPPTPTNVGAPIAAITAGDRWYCAIDTMQQLRCWGSNTYGQLGRGNIEPHGDDPGDMPALIVDVGGDVVLADAGDDHICVVLATGGTRCWGYNENGQLGLGHTNHIGDQPNEMPPAPVNLGGTPLQLAVGADYNCALFETGKVRCWGSHVYGYGNNENIGDTPGEMPPPDLDLGNGTVVALAPGNGHNCVLFQDGTVRCWGLNTHGQLGLGHTNHIGDNPGEMPPPVVNVGGTVVQLSLGYWHSCALLDTGNVRCWGYNNNGQLGIGNTSSIGDQPGEMPPADLDLGGDAASLLLGMKARHNCAIMADSSLRCWGRGASGALGLGSTDHLGDQPGEMPPLPVPTIW
jgi:cysteine-rich repeat protein